MTFPADTTPIADAPAGTETLGGSTPTHTEHHDALTAGLNAVTLELGANPSGSEVDVAARFAAIEAENTAQGVDLAAAESDIASLQADVAALPGGDSRVFDAVAYGAVVDGTTDDTAAWQAAINAAAAAGGGVVTSSVNGVSIIAGALQDTSGANAQLTLPQVDYVDGEALSITIAGLNRPAVVPSVIGATPIPDGCLVLNSTLAAGTGAVIGATGPAGTTASFTNLHARFENLIVRTVANPTLTAVDLRRVAAASIGGRVVVDTGSHDVDSLTQPTTATSFGVRFPATNNGAETEVDRLDVIGFYNAVEFGEHFNAQHVATWGCRVGLVPTAANHGSHIKRFMPVHCTTGIKPTGAHSLDIEQYNVEHANTSQGWRQTTYDIDDASNYLSSFVRWWAVLAGTGAHNVFTKSGGTGVTTSRVGDAIGTGGGGSAVYEYRDRLVAGTSNTTLNLGATPVTNSPLVWVNNVIKWPGTDYTISGATVTFSSALTAGDVVLVQYRSTASSAAASSLSGGGVSILDNFTRADSSSSMGSTSTGSKAWTALAGTWGITLNKGYLASAPAGGLGFAVIDAAIADCTFSTVVTATSGNPNCGLVFRATDASNLYLCEVAVGSAYTPKIYKRVGGTLTTIATGASVTFASGDTLSVVLAGTSITVKRNGTTVVSVTDSTYTTQTKHGYYAYGATGTDPLARFDDLSITS